MYFKEIVFFLSFVLLFGSCQEVGEKQVDESPIWVPNANEHIDENEKYFKSLHQMTFGGSNAEAYFSFADGRLVFQASNDAWDVECDQIFLMDLTETYSNEHMPPRISTGLGRTTCSYFLPGDSLILYSSTHLGGDPCPPPPERGGGQYIWPIYRTFDIFIADLEGNVVNQLTDNPGYDAEATVSPKGDKIVFTSFREDTRDLNLYTMDLDGGNLKQITHERGYQGGAFFSPDGSQIVFRGSAFTTDEEVEHYKEMLGRDLVQPTKMEIFVVDADGSNLRQVTDLGGANWAPFFHPSGDKIIFSSNHHTERGHPFNLFMINVDGTGLEQITFGETFESFPMFSHNGDYLVFSSSRNNIEGTRDINVFIAEWDHERETRED